MNSERRILTQAEKESAYQTEHGAASIYFLPLEKQADLFGGFHTAPSREEYDKALAIAKKAVASRYGADALETLGDYQTGVMHQENSSGESGEPQFLQFCLHYSLFADAPQEEIHVRFHAGLRFSRHNNSP